MYPDSFGPAQARRMAGAGQQRRDRRRNPVAPDCGWVDKALEAVFDRAEATGPIQVFRFGVCRVEADQEKPAFARPRRRRQLAGRIYCQRMTVENQFVLASDAIEVDQRSSRLRVAPAQDLGPVDMLSAIERRRIDRDDHVCPGRSRGAHRAGNPPGPNYFSRSAIAEPNSTGERTVVTPASSSAAYLASAVPLPPAMIAPACPMRLPGGAVTPAM